MDSVKANFEYDLPFMLHDLFINSYDLSKGTYVNEQKSSEICIFRQIKGHNSKMKMF